MLHLFLLCLIPLCVRASESSRSQYLELIENHPSLISHQGSWKKGEIEIVTDPSKMEEIEKLIGRDVGIIAQDFYWLWINDACLFPSGKPGVYGRILWRKSLKGLPAVIVMPITKEGFVTLNCNFRHATRSWEIELPRGLIEPGETPEEAAIREAHEETGKVINSLTLLGTIPTDSGVTTSLCPFFVATVVSSTHSHQEESEAIECTLELSIPEIKQALLQGYYPCMIRGELCRVYCRDPFLAYGILLYETKS